MLPWILLSLASARGFLARVMGLRWLNVGGFDLAVPAAIAIVIWATAPQLGYSVGGVPFWAAWLAGTAAAVAVVAALRLRPRARPLPGPSRPAATTPGPSRPPATAPTPSRPPATAPTPSRPPATAPAPSRPPATAPAPARPRAAILGVTLVAGVVISWLLYDLWFWGHTNHLYDLNVYLGSASRWMEGGHAYLTGPLTAWPTDPRSDYLLYPPPLLPVFAALSKLPEGPISVGWIAFLVGCAYKAFRFLGLPRVWSLAMLAFPPVAIGFESGNVASLTFLLFTASVRTGGTLIVDWLFKTQTGLPTLWLIRERRWRGLLAGTAVLVAIVLITLPLVGVDSWRAWFDGLGYRATSQANVPALYGFSAAAYLPGWAFVGLAVALVAVALLFRGRSGLAAFGVATIFASPSLWPHGFAFALPAVLMLENGAAVWLVLGAGATGSNMWALFYLGLVAVLAARRLPSGHIHPLAGTDGPWPDPRRMIAVRARRSGLPPAEPAPPVSVSAPPVVFIKIS